MRLSYDISDPVDCNPTCVSAACNAVFTTLRLIKKYRFELEYFVVECFGIFNPTGGKS
jgi:hypothetical protein